MMKILLLTFFVMGLTAGIKLGSKTKTQQRFKASLEAECENNNAQEKANIAEQQTMSAIECFYNTIDSTNASIEYGPHTKATIIDEYRKVCKVSVQLQGCIHDILTAMSPCSSASVQAQIEDLKKAITELFDFVCEDNCKRISDFLEDGGYECLEDKSGPAEACFAKINNLFTDIPEDITTYEAFDACHRYDEMMACTQNVFSECPNAYTKKFVQDVLTKLRKGTYCHVTLPLPETPATPKDTQL